MAPKKSKSQLSAEQDAQSIVSVYDFLYQDGGRIASFISQFDDFGHLTALTHNEQASRSGGSSGGGGVSGGLPGVASGSADHSVSESEGHTRALSRSYDPLWANALTLLDYLDERGMICRDIKSARLGQFVLVSGDLTVRDLSLIQKALQLNSLQQISQGQGADTSGLNRKQRRAKGKSIQSSESSKQDFGFEFLHLLPHTIQMIIESDEFSGWSVLNADGLVASPSDFLLKHGVNIPGQWYILGVIDATPNDEEIPAEEAVQVAEDAIPDGDIEGIQTIATKGMGGFLDEIAPMIRLMFGRRDTQYGLTTLLIFRRVSA